MTATSTTELEAMLATRKTAIAASEPISATEAEIVADVVTGEIVPVSAVTDQGEPPSPVSAAAPAEPVVHYPEVPPKVVGGLPYIREYVKLSRTIMMTEMVPEKFRGRYDAITAAFMRGYELGLGPMQSLDSFNVIDGKVGLTAEAMRALIMQAGHLFVLSEGGDYAEVTAHRKDWPADMTTVYRYSMQDADTAGLLRTPSSGRKGGWQKNPRAMLAARATSGAARAWFADVIAGMSYTPEEIQDFEEDSSTWQSAPASTSPSTTPPEPLENAVEQPTPEPLTSSEPSPEPPKRPRGRPRKDAKPPLAAVPPPEPEVMCGHTETAQNVEWRCTLAAHPMSPDHRLVPTPNAEPEPEPEPELTSLNTPEEPPCLEDPADPGVTSSAGEAAVLVQTRAALTQIIKSLPTLQQPLCRAFMAQHFDPKTSVDLNAEELQKCIDIAAGWPDSASQHPLPAENPQLAF
jgi:hypothetical protein